MPVILDPGDYDARLTAKRRRTHSQKLHALHGGVALDLALLHAEALAFIRLPVGRDSAVSVD